MENEPNSEFNLLSAPIDLDLGDDFKNAVFESFRADESIVSLYDAVKSVLGQTVVPMPEKSIPDEEVVKKTQQAATKLLSRRTNKVNKIFGLETVTKQAIADALKAEHPEIAENIDSVLFDIEMKRQQIQDSENQASTTF
ncbi:MAG TPA: hypothetical protein VMR51_01035 [Patescibacteria group bacterium]|jgi:hypothetical protein|nr:hypothetical protein [Patescibacteria group bacterium]